MPRWAWSPATATAATGRSPACGEPPEHWRAAVGTRTSTAHPDAREPALLGRNARGPVHAPALRVVRQGATLSAAGLPALLLDGQHLQGSVDRRRDPQLDGLPSSLQFL